MIGMSYVGCYLEPQRRETRAADVMAAFAEGCGGRLITTGRFDPDAREHAIIGNWLTSARLVPTFERYGLPYWYMDSCLIKPAAVEPRYYRLTRNGMAPTLRPHTMERAEALGVRLQPWRPDGNHVLVCAQGRSFGRPWRIDARSWLDGKLRLIRQLTKRPIRVRQKAARYVRPLAADLAGAWAVVTHSSTAAVEAAIAGIPVFCAPTCAAAAVGCEDMARIEAPVMPEREAWVAALAWCQWTMDEMASGMAWREVR